MTINSSILLSSISLPQLYNQYLAIQKEIEVTRADYQQRQEELWNIKNELRLKKIGNRMISELRELFQ